tara:strand:+ start:610 stop:861 length:252 start_codon:yes stop_codon:yes gene_type:complete
MKEIISKKITDNKEEVIFELQYKNLTIFLISELIKPEQNTTKIMLKNREATVIAKIPSEAERGIKFRSDPTTVSPNNPPMPKL